MAVTDITISQNNKAGAVDLLAVHNPLVFLIDVTYTTIAPDKIQCEIYDKDMVLLGLYNPIFYRDLTADVRQFALISDAILRSFMSDFNDFTQVNNSIVHVPNATKQFTIKAVDGIFNDSVTIQACHGSRQFSENPAMSDIYNNTTEKIIGYVNSDIYVYFYNSDITKTLTFSIS